MSQDDEDAALAQQALLEQEESKMSIVEQLADVQRQLKAPKGQFNKFGGYKYRSCEDILEAVKPYLNGIALTIQDELVMVGDRIYVKATATVSNGRESISTSAFAREPVTKKGMDESQITGAASSYARKYALNGLLLIDDTKDADATNDHGNKTAKAEPKAEAKAKAVSATDGAFDALSDEEADTAVDCVTAIREAWEAGHEYGAYEIFSTVDNRDVQVAIWELLRPDSKIRSAIKRFSAEERAAQEALNQKEVAA